MMLEACLGISINAKQQQVAFDKPCLPEVLPFVEVKDLKIGVASVNLAFWRSAEKVHVEVTNRRGDVEILLPQP